MEFACTLPTIQTFERETIGYEPFEQAQSQGVHSNVIQLAALDLTAGNPKSQLPGGLPSTYGGMYKILYIFLLCQLLNDHRHV